MNGEKKVKTIITQKAYFSLVISSVGPGWKGYTQAGLDNPQGERISSGECNRVVEGQR